MVSTSSPIVVVSANLQVPQSPKEHALQNIEKQVPKNPKNRVPQNPNEQVSQNPNEQVSLNPNEQVRQPPKQHHNADKGEDDGLEDVIGGLDGCREKPIEPNSSSPSHPVTTKVTIPTHKSQPQNLATSPKEKAKSNAQKIKAAQNKKEQIHDQQIVSFYAKDSPKNVGHGETSDQDTQVPDDQNSTDNMIVDHNVLPDSDSQVVSEDENDDISEEENDSPELTDDAHASQLIEIISPSSQMQKVADEQGLSPRGTIMFSPGSRTGPQQPGPDR
uniref:Uncharacterized protein n=1 Tax=Solanum tuberosum TaxID=4113 RepID=M1DQ30_SOLTU